MRRLGSNTGKAIFPGNSAGTPSTTVGVAVGAAVGGAGVGVGGMSAATATAPVGPWVGARSALIHTSSPSTQHTCHHVPSRFLATMSSV